MDLCIKYLLLPKKILSADNGWFTPFHISIQYIVCARILCRPNTLLDGQSVLDVDQ